MKTVASGNEHNEPVEGLGKKSCFRLEPWKRKGRIAVVTTGLGLASVIWAVNAQSSDLVYRPINPSFGGDSFNTNHLVGLADRQNQHKEDGSSASRYSNTPADQFVRQLQSRMLSSLSQQVNDAIFGENAAESGRIVFGDQIISFDRGLEGVHLLIENMGDGSRTEVTVPTLQVN